LRHPGMHAEWGAKATRHHSATIEDVRREAKRHVELPNSLRELRRMWGACE
jgi:hypothetical protein